MGTGGAGNDFRFWQTPSVEHLSLPKGLAGGYLGFPAWGEDRGVIGGQFASSGNPGGSGTGPEQALEAINLIPRAPRESRSAFELPCALRSGPAEPNPGRGDLPAIPDNGIFRNHPRIQTRESFPAPVSRRMGADRGLVMQ